MTIASTVLLCDIENLAAVVMSQLIEPGAPVLSGHHRLTLDMLTGKSLMASVEAILGETASAGYGTGSPLPDEQFMIDGTLLGLRTSLGGMDILEGAGGLDDILVISPVQLILDSALASLLKWKGSGMKADDDTLAWEEILDTAPGDHFLKRPHIFQHSREALRPALFNYQPREIWSSGGGKNLNIRALERYRELKQKLEPLRLPEDVKTEMNQIIEQAGKQLIK